jgi:hypothetical protein
MSLAQAREFVTKFDSILDRWTVIYSTDLLKSELETTVALAIFG